MYIPAGFSRISSAMNDAKFVTGYTGPHSILQSSRREVDARVTTGETMLVRSREWLEKGAVDIHAGN